MFSLIKDIARTINYEPFIGVIIMLMWVLYYLIVEQ